LRISAHSALRSYVKGASLYHWNRHLTGFLPLQVVWESDIHGQRYDRLKLEVR